MKDDKAFQAAQAIAQAKSLLRKGNRQKARQLALRAAALTPDQEEPWLLLAALSGYEASIAYLRRALVINPASERARKGMHWAAQRLRTVSLVHRTAVKSSLRLSRAANWMRVASVELPEPIIGVHQRPVFLWLVISLVLCSALFITGAFFPFGPAQAQVFSAPRALVALVKPSFTPTATHTHTPTNTPTPTSTPTNTPTPTATNTPTPVPTDTPQPTETPVPTKPKVPTSAPPSANSLPKGVDSGERWIDVDLTHQRVYAYEGTTLVNSFLVSTGTWQHPTVTGQYRIYVKYRYTTMSGPGYYLPNVPYTMYFYQGYGLHGTYWHHNFGTPMSHGCINLSTPDAGWLFGWASVGTLVNIHY
jgi:lipoprotein-anchoring transpeptidase ErfK/SrfK